MLTKLMLVNFNKKNILDEVSIPLGHTEVHLLLKEHLRMLHRSSVTHNKLNIYKLKKTNENEDLINDLTITHDDNKMQGLKIMNLG